ncbi:hypothetical protein QYF36_013896 [Acer negundo]|nr:hypothetical protein QYF36_013896 [Acer negundo]
MVGLRQDGCQSWPDVINHGRKASPGRQSPPTVVAELLKLRVNQRRQPVRLGEGWSPHHRRMDPASDGDEDPFEM